MVQLPPARALEIMSGIESISKSRRLALAQECLYTRWDWIWLAIGAVLRARKSTSCAMELSPSLKRMWYLFQGSFPIWCVRYTVAMQGKKLVGYCSWCSTGPPAEEKTLQSRARSKTSLQCRNGRVAELGDTPRLGLDITENWRFRHELGELLFC